MINKYTLGIAILAFIINKNYINNKKIYVTKETQTDLTMKKIKQLEDYEDDLITIFNSNEEYKWKFID